MPNEHYFTPEPTAAGKRREFTVTVRGHRLRFVTEAGVFSRRRLDPGTRLLLAHLEVGEDDRVLDLGCGYGVVGVAAARLAPRGVVTLVDINSRAVALAEENLRLNEVENARAVQSDGYEAVAGERFDVIALNPPIRAGLAVVHRLIEESAGHLRPGGRFYLVARTRQGALRLGEKMRKALGHVEETAKRGGFRLYVSRV